MCGVFGLPGWRISYLDWVRLALNEGRARMRNAADLAAAFELAHGDGPLDPAWADALGRDPLEGGEVVDAANAARASARAMRAMRGG